MSWEEGRAYFTLVPERVRCVIGLIYPLISRTLESVLQLEKSSKQRMGGERGLPPALPPEEGGGSRHEIVPVGTCERGHAGGPPPFAEMNRWSGIAVPLPGIMPAYVN